MNSSIARTKQSIMRRPGDPRGSTTIKLKEAEQISKTFHNGGSIWRSQFDNRESCKISLFYSSLVMNTMQITHGVRSPKLVN